MRRTLAATLIAIAAFFGGGSVVLASRTPITFKDVSDAGAYFVVWVTVEQASRNSQVLFFLKYAGRDDLVIAESVDAGTPLPTTRDRLPAPDDRSRNLYKSIWWMRVAVDRIPERPAQIYAVAVESQQGLGDRRDVDMRSLRYLPYKQATSLDKVLAMLNDFGWTPTGYTKIEAPQLPPPNTPGVVTTPEMRAYLFERCIGLRGKDGYVRQSCCEHLQEHEAQKAVGCGRAR